MRLGDEGSGNFIDRTGRGGFGGFGGGGGGNMLGCLLPLVASRFGIVGVLVLLLGYWVAMAGDRVFAMDSDAVVSAFDLATGRRIWRTETQDDKDRSTNVGGGIATVEGVVYVSTGRADMLALDAGTGAIRWRKPLGSPARSARSSRNTLPISPTRRWRWATRSSAPTSRCSGASSARTA